jgi:bacteriocin-like protein
MIPTEIPVTELTDTELDAVSGGFLNALNIINQQNIAVPVGVAVGGGLGSPAAVLQTVGQLNFSA